MVRRATLDDAGRIIDLTQRFNDKYFDVPICLIRTTDRVIWVIEEGISFVSDAGFIGGMIVEDLFRDWTVLQEFGWYAEDNSGRALLRAFVKAGRENSVDDIRICTLATSSEFVGGLLQQEGFAPLETSYRLLTGATSCPQLQPSSPSQP